MNVTLLGRWPEGELVGGVARYTVNLVKSLGQIEELKTHFISFGTQSQTINLGNAKITMVKARKLYYFLPFLAILRLLKEVNKVKPDVIHIQGSNLSPYILLAGLLRKKYSSVLLVLGVVALESQFGYGVKNTLWAFLSKITEKYFISKFENIIVETQSIKKLLEKQTDTKISVITTGVELEKYLKIKQHKSIEHPDLFIACKIEKLKGIDLVIKSIPYVLKKVPDLMLFIAGSGPQEKELKLLTKQLNLENHVKFLGFISEEKKYHYYQSCKAVIVPSRWDCQPTTIFEAAASGKPVIVSDKSNPEIVLDGKTGFIFQSENVDQLAEKIILLLTNETLREKMGASAKEAAKQYDWSETARRFFQVYNEIAK
jgi:glycosyltransferase involved in cell wall biosynthesis